jgi:hypothetical protein
MLPLIIFKFPETKGLSLEDIGALFGDETAPEDAVGSEQGKSESNPEIVHQRNMDWYRRGGLEKSVADMSKVEIEDVEKHTSAKA